ncbi:putative transcription factor, MBF1 like protein [Bernardetia litoralis DSM 6794]|uniref:Putative transcription factor, MBF1 like protein n=1 Tax=Bernardetia litoralis (strain ATCC 23117 / DSM 6794 / NBRC 15988 / NCIMB 1366 / Fx l1 / Sio-4) TaxID=880071 RepID=I4AGH7_BERLS|nr:helix-turn-helix transcriptional regulator [Bernardetia litoralis]AFM03062.1 putative transcription factor, MBF1 like protein [Bernardetia litoralis DSM 6794]
MTIGNKIKTLRSLKGLSQENMAELLEISTTSYAKIERDEVDIKESRVEQIAAILGISALELRGFGERNFYYFHANNQNGNHGGFVVNNSVPMEFNEMRNKIEKLEIELNYLKEIIQVTKSN